MKKVLALLFASTLILGACGDKNDESKMILHLILQIAFL